jgi:hypothetical protein
VVLICEFEVPLPWLLFCDLIYFALWSWLVTRRLLSDADARQRVDAVVDALGLGGVALSLVGNAFILGISGGE